MMPPALSNAHSEALPLYEAAIAERSSAQSPNIPLAPDEQPEIPPFDPPAFSMSPITLSILPNSFLIQATLNSGGTFPTTHHLYELTQSLDGHCSNTTIADIPPGARLRADGRCCTIWKKQLLYKICQDVVVPRSPRVTAISAQNRNLIQGTFLKRGMGFGRSWEARSHGPDWQSENTLLYHAKQSKGFIEWKDAKEKVIAVEIPAVHRESDVEKLEILEPLDKQMFDMLVAVWIARVWQDARVEGLRQEEDAKKRKEEQEARDKEDGKSHGKLHDMKEALGIGYGVKHGPRNACMFTGPPTIRDDGRIKWS
jgi:hypothetical protein